MDKMILEMQKMILMNVGKIVTFISNSLTRDLVFGFSEQIPEAAIRQIAAAKPLRAVFRDSSFKSDSAKINVTEIFKTISPNTTVKVV